MLKGVAGVASDLRRVGRVVRAVARRVADGAIDQHLAAPPHAELDRRMNAAPVEPLDRLPDAFDPDARRPRRWRGSPSASLIAVTASSDAGTRHVVKKGRRTSLL